MTRLRNPGRRRRDGTALVIVLWIALGLVSVALYFGNASALELRAADNRVAAVEAAHAIDGAARYALFVITNAVEPGVLPDPATYQREGVALGDARFWFLGRDYRNALPAADKASFGIVDECSKLNLNTATVAMLTNLPGVTPEFAAAIVDWRDADGNASDNGAEDDYYLRLNPPYHCKNAPFESVDELRMVAGGTPDVLFGEDANLNGVLDANENDGTVTPPLDNRDGHLDPGILEYVTVHSSDPATLPDGTARVNVAQQGATQRVASLLQERLGSDRSNQVLRALGPGNQVFRSVLEFYIRSQMTVNEFIQLETNLVATAAQNPVTPVNVNTASETVLACIPGIGLDYASQVVSFRQANTDRLNTVAWVAEVLPRQNAIQAGPYLTGHSYQYSADIAAVGHLGRGYRRVRYVFDVSGPTPRIVARRDLGHLGWALGRDVRERQLSLLTQNPR